jgi:hypothetical protein
MCCVDCPWHCWGLNNVAGDRGSCTRERNGGTRRLLARGRSIVLRKSRRSEASSLAACHVTIPQLWYIQTAIFLRHCSLLRVAVIAPAIATIRLPPLPARPSPSPCPSPSFTRSCPASPGASKFFVLKQTAGKHHQQTRQQSLPLSHHPYWGTERYTCRLALTYTRVPHVHYGGSTSAAALSNANRPGGSAQTR